VLTVTTTNHEGHDDHEERRSLMNPAVAGTSHTVRRVLRALRGATEIQGQC
jgi:hypothetical protein